MTIRERLANGETVTLSTINDDANAPVFTLTITKHTSDDELDWDEFDWKDRQSLITDYYEVITTDGTLEQDLTHNIDRDDGWVFRLIPPEDKTTCEFGFISILTERGPDGEVIVPDEPYDKGFVELDGGVYRVVDSKTSQSTQS